MRPKESHPGASPGRCYYCFYCKMEVIPGGTAAWMPL
nr:MAG TPA: xylose kinase [Caudoviricetes sp.]